MSDFMDEHFQESQITLNRLTNTLDRLGIKYVAIPNMFGRSVAISYGGHDIVMLSVCGPPGHNAVQIVSPILKDLERNRPLILEECNRRTSGNPSFPVFLHDAEAGWAMLTAVATAAQLMVDTPMYFRGLIEHLPTVAAEIRHEARSAGIVGTEFGWEIEDLKNLAIRSVM